MSYVVDETLSGRSDRIKSYAVGIEVFGRAPDFDASGDPIVRNTARRLRAALTAYYEDEGAEDAVVIQLPKGRYVPEFAFSQDATGKEQSVPPEVPLPGAFGRVRTYFTGALLAVVALVAILAFAIAAQPSQTRPTIMITVEPTEALYARHARIATSIDARLAPEMARLGIATITALSPGGIERADIPSGAITLSLQSAIGTTDGEDPVLLWRLVDQRSGALLWASREPQPNDMLPSDIDTTVQRLAFRMLGENGVLTRSLPGLDGATDTRTACLSRAQALVLIYTESDRGELRSCLENLTSQDPLDATAWAVLSTYFTIKSEALGLEGHNTGMLEHAAERALHTAIDLAPNAYATQVAQMYLSFNQGRIADFDAAAERLLASYPGAAYLQVRIANRYIRLGRMDAGALLLTQAITALNITAGHEFSGMALASYHAGRYEEALAFLDQSGPTATELPLLLRIAIFGQLGDLDAALQAAETASRAAPGLMADFPRILRDRKWSDDIIEHISEGIRKAEISAVRTIPPV